MARVLAYTTPMLGHLFPIVPVLDVLQARGHEIHLRTKASHADATAARGWQVQPVDPAAEAVKHDDTTGSVRNRLRHAIAAFVRRGSVDAPDLKRAIASARPDVLLIDANSWGAQAAAEASGLPWASFMPYPLAVPGPGVPPFGPGLPPARGALGRLRDRLLTPVFVGGFASMILPGINELRAHEGLPPLSNGLEIFARPPLLIYFTAEPFEYHREHWPANVVMVGPCAWEPPSDPPAWLDEDPRPLVLVSTSSDYQGDERLVTTAFAALADRDDLRVVATMPSADTDGIAVPANGRIERFAPHGPLLDRAATVICHGGMGVTQKALAAGVPVCAVPFGRDQAEVARRLEVCGAGTRLPASRLSPKRLRRAVEDAMARRERARQVAAAFRDAGNGEAAASAIEVLLAS